MVILYPHNQRFFLRRAHDILVMKTCHALARRGHQVYLLMGKTLADAETLVRYYGLDPHPNLHLVQLPILRRNKWPRLSWHGIFNFYCQRALRRLIREVSPDLIYLSEIKLAKHLLRCKSLVGVPFVYEIHGLSAPGYEQPAAIEAEVFSQCRALITTTVSLQDVMEKLYTSLPPLYRVPLATEIPAHVSVFAPPDEGEPWRIGYFGQLYPLQGVDVLLRALTYLPADARLEIIGGRDDHIAALRQLADREGISERVAFHGFVPPPEVPQKALQAHIFVLPCLAEKKMPYVAHTKLYEYLAMCRPIVAADVPSVHEEITDGVNGLLFRPGDPEALAAAVRRVMEAPQDASVIAAKGWELARQFTWEARAERLETCFAEVLQQGFQ